MKRIFKPWYRRVGLILGSLAIVASIVVALLPSGISINASGYLSIDLSRVYAAPPNWLSGWGKLVKTGLFIQNIPGSHYTVLQDPNVEWLAEGLRRIIS